MTEAQQSSIEERPWIWFTWLYQNLPPIIFLPLLLAAFPFAVLVMLCIPPKYTGLFDD